MNMLKSCCRSRVGSAANTEDRLPIDKSHAFSDTLTSRQNHLVKDVHGSKAIENDSKHKLKVPGVETGVQKISSTEVVMKQDSGFEDVVNNCWSQIEEQRTSELKERNKKSPKSKIQSKGWKTIRVFVSSTFTDMHNEREILVKKVFPALREWCEERKFTLIDCDLRWGVPKDSTTRTTICTCLEELDRCYEDNEDLPFFINMLSERYGWIPSDKEVPDDVQNKYKWIPQVSITHMEILHGAYRFDNPNALFCLRDSSFIKDLSADKLSKFVDKEALNKSHLKVLKENLICRFPKQTFVYKCQVAGIDMSTGREKVNLVGLEPFGERVLSFLREAIERQYPDHHLAPDMSSAEQEENGHASAMQVKSSFVVGRDQELAALLGYISAGTVNADMMNDRKKEEDEESDVKEDLEKEALEECEQFGVQMTDSRLVAVVGGSGFGKSALLAKLAVMASLEGRNVLYHNVGATIESLKPANIAQRLEAALQILSGSVPENSSDNESERDNGDEEDFNTFEAMCSALRMAEASNVQLDLILDGIDQLNDNQSSRFLAWFPPRFPANLRCVVSTRADHYPCIARLESRQAHFFPLSKLSTDAAADVVKNYLSRFNKALDPDQMACLLKHSSACLPTWLAVVCEEMRVFGDFATITAKIKGFPDNLEELMQEVLKRLLREDETQSMEKVLSLMYCSKVGLPENSILKLLGNLEKEEAAPMIKWATNRRFLKPFINTVMKGPICLIRAANEEFNDAVKDVVLADDKKRLKWHAHIADFYQHHCDDEWLVLEELPRQLLQAGQWLRLKEFYRKDLRTFNSSSFTKSQHFTKMRCQTFVARNMPMICHPVVVCTFCKGGGNLLSPQPFPTSDCCAVCGSWSPPNVNSVEAVLCQRHCYRNRVFAECLTCGKSVNLDAPEWYHIMSLCNMCSGGVGGLTCCRVLDYP